MIELKPCPFCGGKDVQINHGAMWGYAAHCNECGADVIFWGMCNPLNLDGDYREELARAWNRRAE